MVQKKSEPKPPPQRAPTSAPVSGNRAGIAGAFTFGLIATAEWAGFPVELIQGWEGFLYYLVPALAVGLSQRIRDRGYQQKGDAAISRYSPV